MAAAPGMVIAGLAAAATIRAFPTHIAAGIACPHANAA
jgi:hypothetical protein